jgi:hypothetical protein
MGGLGNQLFQIFTTLAYSIEHNRKMILPYSDTLTTGITRITYWDSFLSMLKKHTTFNEDHYYENSELFMFSYYREPFHHYLTIPYFTEENKLLYGYYQSYKYFEKHSDTLFSMIQLAEQKENIIEKYPQYFNPKCKTISMHFRLGDYKEKQDYHPVMPYDYYDNALFHILLHRDLTKTYTVLYFCEEEDNYIVNSIIRKLMSKYPVFKFVKVDDKIEDWKQLLIMSCCNDNIIANSSFSWWAGYFNDTFDKIVCYPHLWFGPKANNKTYDMFPTSWTIIEW